MAVMTWLSGTGFVDVVIAITLLEALGLWVWSRFRGGIDFDALAPSLASGLMLMVALRMAVGGAAWPWIVLPVAVSGLAHLWDLRRRWSRAPVTPLGASRPAPSSPH